MDVASQQGMPWVPHPDCLVAGRCHGEAPVSQRLTTLFFEHVILNSVKELLFAVEKADPSLRSG